MIRKAVIVFLVLAALGTAGMWVDSYGVRKPTPLSPEWEAILANATVSYGVPDPTAMLGLYSTHRFENRKAISVRTCQGSFNLRFDCGIKTGTPVTQVDSSWGGFGHQQWVHRRWTHWGRDGRPDVHDDYLVREVVAPFWFLTTVLAAYPGFYLIRGAFRRWKRTVHSCCAGCGYNLTGNVSGRCPECGKEIDTIASGE